MDSGRPSIVSTDVLEGRLGFVQAAGRLKDTLRSGYTLQGRQESTADHTWRLCLLAMVMQADMPQGVDLAHVLALCVVHDLGEAIGGDIPAPLQGTGGHQTDKATKAAQERADLQTLLAPLPAAEQAQWLALWDEYDAAATPAARWVKGLDKLETLITHNQGANPPGFDYGFNLHYARQHTATHPVLQQWRDRIDQDTLQRMPHDPIHPAA